MNLHFTNSFQKKVRKLLKKDPGLRKDLKKQFKLFEINPHHPSLKTHKLKGKRSIQYSVWIKSNWRALAIKNKA